MIQKAQLNCKTVRGNRQNSAVDCELQDAISLTNFIHTPSQHHHHSITITITILKSPSSSHQHSIRQPYRCEQFLDRAAIGQPPERETREEMRDGVGGKDEAVKSERAVKLQKTATNDRKRWLIDETQENKNKTK